MFGFQRIGDLCWGGWRPASAWLPDRRYFWSYHPNGEGLQHQMVTATFSR
ncbi:hypothetical protein ACNKHS_00800 [Shigella flexneri]